MNIIIAGAGTVGYSLAQTLSLRHNVVVVDKEPQTINRLDNNMDVMTITGNIKDPKTFQKLDVESMDLFIAVTDSDEANILSTLIVDENINIDKKIIRLKDDYFEDSTILNKLGVTDAIFPDTLTALKVASLFDFPKANNVKSFDIVNHKLISVHAGFKDEETYTVEDLNGDDVFVLGIERDKKYFIPKISDDIKTDDLIYLFGNSKKIKEISSKLDNELPSVVKKVAIFGANPLAIKIAKELVLKNIEIKMIDKNIDLCEKASDILQDNVTVINAIYDDHHSLFDSEGLKNADIVIAAGRDDEKNIVKCIESREYGIKQVIAINNDKTYYNLMHKLGIVVVRGAKAGAYYDILEKIASNEVVLERHFCGGNAVLFLRKIDDNSKLIGKDLKECYIENTTLFLVRDEKIYSVGEIPVLKVSDIVVLSGTIQKEEEIAKWIYTL
ncbi:Trk system potassium uptake protein TrkA [hydrothermal vent metagenome]|uniref:Trk system potassium uptake protein TrkA n=1 Tax=hydrothermal vent metagenome TaxID=652676 RepID=A0A1W1EG36_9ZZZZ